MSAKRLAWWANSKANYFQVLESLQVQVRDHKISQLFLWDFSFPKFSNYVLTWIPATFRRIFRCIFSVWRMIRLFLTTHTLKSSDRAYVRNFMLISIFNQSICAYPFLIMKVRKNLYSKMFDHITCDSYNLKRSSVWNFLRKNTWIQEIVI